MKPSEKAALRKSVRQLAAQAVYNTVFRPDGAPRTWLVIYAGGRKRRVWHGHEVEQACREVYLEVCKALKVKP